MKTFLWGLLGCVLAGNALAADVPMQSIILVPRSAPPPTPWNGQCWILTAGGLFCHYNGVTIGPYIDTAGSTSFANPSATVGPTAVPGSAPTAMRSDASPPLANTAVTPGAYTNSNITVDAQGRVTSAGNGSSSGSPANPTATVGPAAIPGSAGTFMRSDAAPALANTAVTPGAYTNLNATVDAQGRVTSASNGSSSGSPANPTATVGPSAIPGSAPTFMRSDAAPALANTAVTAGSYTSSNITVDAQGRVTSAANGSGGSPANPTATAGPAPTNGSAPTFMRSDAAPAIQKASDAQLGLAQGDGVSLSCNASTGVCGAKYPVETVKTAAFPVAAINMNKLTPVNIAGGGTITLPLIGAFSTFFAADQTWCVQNIGTTADPISNLTGGIMYPTITSLLPDNTICFSSNGAALFAETKVNNSPSRSAASPTIGVGDMTGTVFITSGGFTIQPVSAGLFDNKQTTWVVNYGGSAAVPTNSSGQAIKTGGGCVAASGIPVGGSWALQPDAIGSTFSFDCVQGISSATLASSGVTAGSYTNANITVNAQGLVTVAANGSGGGGGGVSGTSALGTSAIGSAACATVVTTAAAGAATTDSIAWGFNSDPTAVTGYVPLVAGMLSVVAYPSSGNVNFKVCNSTASSVTPGAITLNWRVLPASAVVATGTSALGTGAIASATCATVVTTSATGAATTDVPQWGFNGDPTAVTGYVPATTGMLSIVSYPTANNINFKVCNNTSASVTPGAITLNWKVIH